MDKDLHKETVTPREALLARADKLKVLPTLAPIIDKVLSVAADDNASFRDLSDVLKYDQAISSKIISIANSAYFSRGSQTVSLERAMAAIGLDEVRRIVMCLVFLKEMLGQCELSQGDLASLWRHTLSVACAARTLAEKTLAEDSEKVFTAAILHDVGKVPFLLHGDAYRTVQEEARRTGRDVCSLEREAFGIDHAELGRLVSTKWRFPEEFSAVILGHHGGHGTAGTLVDIVMKADRFTENPQSDIGPEGIILRRESERIKAETKRIAELLGVA
ncbi:MAG: HDOD domain-containing protein [Syntrophorhabdales bacterium]|jgi:putative nucleotidyltransferase with HDIG domain